MDCLHFLSVNSDVVDVMSVFFLFFGSWGCGAIMNDDGLYGTWNMFVYSDEGKSLLTVSPTG